MLGKYPSREAFDAGSPVNWSSNLPASGKSAEVGARRLEQRAVCPRTRHAAAMVLLLAVLALSRTLEVRQGDRVVIPQLGISLPGLCSYRLLLGKDCPGCGLTRSLICLSHGELSAAWTYNPAGLFVFAAIVMQIPYRGLQLWRIRCRQQPWPSHFSWLMLWCIMGAIIAQWLIRAALRLA